MNVYPAYFTFSTNTERKCLIKVHGHADIVYQMLKTYILESSECTDSYFYSI